MSQQTAISYLTLPEALQDIFVRQRTGVMFVRTEQRAERLVMLSGQLYLSGSNPGRERLERVLAGPEGAENDIRFDPASYLVRELGAFVKELVETMAEWRTTDLRFSSELGEVATDIVGPVPTAGLVMGICSRGLSVEELLRRLGGAGARYRAVEDRRFRRRVPELEPVELALLRRLERATSVETLISEFPEASRVVYRLVRLTSVGLLHRESYAGVRSSTISQKILESISERVREDLELEPLELELEAHRARLKELLREYGRLGFFDLLGVGSDDPPEEVHAAFMKLGRLAHPVHAEKLGLLKSRRKLDWLFGRLTEAYLVLSDPTRCAEYKRESSAVPPPRSIGPDARARRSERVQLARERFRTALDHIEEEDYYYAIELLRQAVLSDEQPEYYALLGRCQMQNQQWLHMAVDSFRSALRLRPDDAKLRQELAVATEQYRSYREEARSAEVAPGGRETDDARRAQRILSKLRGESD